MAYKKKLEMEEKWNVKGQKSLFRGQKIVGESQIFAVFYSGLKKFALFFILGDVQSLL